MSTSITRRLTRRLEREVGGMFDVLAPKSKDKRYTPKDALVISLICRADSYKFFHYKAYPNSLKRKIVGMSSYIEARVSPNVTIVPAGAQLVLQKYLTQRVTLEHIDAAEAFCKAHFGRDLFARAEWEKVVNEYDGYLPLIIRGIPEGTPIRGGQPMMTITCLDEDLHWMSTYFETLLQRGVWYPTTIASLDTAIMAEIKRFYEISGAPTEGPESILQFSLHDFGGRGVTCGEQAEIGGFAHLLNFMGSDTVEGVLTANHYYNDPMAAFSVFATEHSIECSFGLDDDGEHAYLAHVLENALPGTIVSIVIDGRDTIRCAKKLCASEADGGFRDLIIKSGAKVVFRPDSGDMMEIVPKLLRMMESAFGSDTNAQGYRKIRHVGIIQGDGVDHMAIKTLLGNILAMGFRADNVVFGSGGALLQKVNRDTFKFAQKAAAVLVRTTVLGAHGGSVTERWEGIAKNPVTDPGKKSKEGVLTLLRVPGSRELITFRLDTGEPMPEGAEDAHVLLYHTGKFYNETALSEMRGRVAAGPLPQL